MARASASIDIAAPPDQVWQLIGGFGSLPDWFPFIPKSELSEGGRVRHLASPNGETVVERLEAFDNAARSYSYSILQAPFPITGYLATLRVQETGGGKSSRVEWFANFTPKGVSDQEASRLFQGIFEEGLAALAAGFATKKQPSVI
jgi:carbon monoxide dehydrogenase subunit G